MNVILQRVFYGAIIVVCSALSLAAQVIDVSGTYRAEGRNPDGSPYIGTAVLSQQGSAVQIHWTVANQTFAGSGVRNGQVVVIDWGRPDPIVYVVMTNGELHGTWDRGTALERLSPQ